MKNKILIIDDEHIIRQSLKQLFELDGYIVFEASNARDGMGILKKYANDDAEFISVVILDVKMPGIDGIELLREIKGMEIRTEIIMMTGHGDTETAIKALRYGAFDYISKPMEYDELAFSIERAIEKQNIIIENKISATKLKESEEKYRNLVERASDGIAILQDTFFKYVNPGLANILGYNVEELMHTSINAHLSLKREQDIKSIDDNNINSLSNIILKHKNGDCKYIELNIGPIKYEDQPAFLLILRDITQRMQDEKKIRYLSFHDSLTGLYNRAFFDEELQRLNREEYLPLSIIMGDVNGLKLVNDAFGHQNGDELLKAAAKIFMSSSRNEDLTVRWGGDEYVCILPNTDEVIAKKICNRIKQTCNKKTEQPIQLSISLGVATKIRYSEDIYKVLKKAEDNMYKNKLMESKSIRYQIISSLQQVLDEKSHETKEHAQRLQKMALKLAEGLGLSDSEADELSLLALLHDIGKVAIPEDLLNKPGRLTSEEFKLIQTHCEIGYRIALSIPEIGYIAEGILSHHERWDGSGYPRGLKGEKIPLVSRIVSIVDAYDVMVNGRIYEKKIKPEEALEEIIKHACTQFDPNIARLFVNEYYIPLDSQAKSVSIK